LSLLWTYLDDIYTYLMFIKSPQFVSLPSVVALALAHVFNRKKIPCCLAAVHLTSILSYLNALRGMLISVNAPAFDLG